MEQPKPNLELQNCFRIILQSSAGLKMMAALCEHAWFFDHINQELDAIGRAHYEGRREMILFILEKCGITDIERMIRALMQVPVQAPEEDQIQEEEVDL